MCRIWQRKWILKKGLKHAQSQSNCSQYTLPLGNRGSKTKTYFMKLKKVSLSSDMFDCMADQTYHECLYIGRKSENRVSWEGTINLSSFSWVESKRSRRVLMFSYFVWKVLTSLFAEIRVYVNVYEYLSK